MIVEDISTHIITILIGIIGAGLAGMFGKMWLNRTVPFVVPEPSPEPSPEPKEAIAVARVEIDRQAEVEQEEVREVLESGDADALADIINKRKR
jgi:hypothetical protein|tara:strand:+ start:320 stop:601 length:282 start_codon:yes stop_codon:yes gene_type:complete